MSNIQTLIETIQAESLEARSLMVADQTWQEYMVDCLLEIKDSIVELKEGMFQYFADEQDRFDQAQEGLKAARRAELERLKESGGRGFATPAKTSDGKVADQPSTDGGGLFAGLGITGLLAGIGAAVTGYTVGVINNLVKLISLGKFDLKLTEKIAQAMKAIPNLIRSVVMSSIMNITMMLDGIKAKLPSGGILGTIGKTVTNIVTRIGSLLNAALNPKPIFDAIKGLTGGGGGGILSRIGSFLGKIGKMFGAVFTAVSKIAVPITGLIAAGKAIYKTFFETDEQLGFFGTAIQLVRNLTEELASGFITYPLELIKKLVSWIAGAFGFEGVEKFLDSFDIDAKFREIFNGTMDAIGEFFTYIGDLIYEGKRGLAKYIPGYDGPEVDPEAEARIAQRELDTVDERIATNEAAMKLDPDNQVYKDRQEIYEADRQQKLKTLAEKQSLIDNPRPPSTEETTPPPKKPEPKYQYPVVDPVSQQVVGTYDSAEEAAAAAAPIGAMLGQPVESTSTSTSSDQLRDVTVTAQRVPGQPVESTSTSTSSDQLREVVESTSTSGSTSSSDQLREVTVPSREYRPETAPSARPTTLAAATPAGDDLLPPNVEPVTPLNQVTSRESAESVLSSLTPMLSGDVSSSSITDMLGDNALSTASSVMASAVTTMLGGNSSALQTTEGDVITNITPAGGLATAPVDRASRQVDAAKSQPTVVAVNGGNSSQNTTNVMNQQTVNMGARSARSQDLGVQTLKDQSLA